MTDFPDYQTYPNAQSDNLFTAFTQTLAPGLHSSPVLPALSWSSLMLIVSPSAGAAQVQINHFADAAGTLQVDADKWPVNTLTNVVVRTPLRSKYVRVDITVTSAGSLTARTWANFLSATSDHISFPVAQQNVSDFNHSLPANGTALYQLGEICAGEALFFYNPKDAAGKNRVSIHAVDELGNSGQLIAYFGLPAAVVQQLIVVPDLMLVVEIDNTDGTAAHLYDFSLTVPPQ